MSKYFAYSLLQYKHSLTLGEALNVGILFYFPDLGKFEFIPGNKNRLKSIYQDFNGDLFTLYLKNISTRVEKTGHVFFETDLKKWLQNYIHENILGEDASALQFSEPVGVVNVFPSTESAIESYSNLLLPGIETEKI